MGGKYRNCGTNQTNDQNKCDRIEKPKFCERQE